MLTNYLEDSGIAISSQAQPSYTTTTYSQTKNIHDYHIPKKEKTRKARRGRNDPPLDPAEAKRRRQDYQRQYYLTHREKAKEYQRQYNLLHKKKQRFPGAKGGNATEFKRDITRMTYNTHDIMHSPAEKVWKMLEKIVAGEKGFTMATKKGEEEIFPFERVTRKGTYYDTRNVQSVVNSLSDIGD